MTWLPGAIAVSDIASALKKYQLAGLLGWQDVRQRYRRSALGPFWLTISMAVMIATIGIVFSQILKTPLQEFLPFLAVGLIVWGFISTVVNEGCGAFISSETIIKQLPIPLFVHVMRLVWRNLIILAHNIVIRRWAPIIPLCWWWAHWCAHRCSATRRVGFLQSLPDLQRQRSLAQAALDPGCDRWSARPERVRPCGGACTGGFELQPEQWRAPRSSRS
ncbi:ABC transporter permease [Pantoea ananatis]|uniref:ABC transporter permease n=1 Tax=Pantoea ananas TaxID=553 RepID=UPI0022200A72|nr:ABC transporter permease [Pantoea ananatis]